MKVQVLVATMGQKDFSLVESMNIKTDAVFANQCNQNGFSENNYTFGNVKMVSTNTKGVGINRNIALMYATGDYLVFADDDLVYNDDYESIIINTFEKIKDADILIFNVKSIYGHSATKKNTKVKRVRWFNSMSYGAIRIVARKDSLYRENVMFSLLFGGGTKFSAGEDSLFLLDMLKKGLRIYTVPEIIATVDDNIDNSTWFNGYDEKYYYDKGAFFRAYSKKFARVLCLQELIRHKFYRNSGLNFKQAYKMMLYGIKGYKSGKSYKGKAINKGRD